MARAQKGWEQETAGYRAPTLRQVSLDAKDLEPRVVDGVVLLTVPTWDLGPSLERAVRDLDPDGTDQDRYRLSDELEVVVQRHLTLRFLAERLK